MQYGSVSPLWPIFAAIVVVTAVICFTCDRTLYRLYAVFGALLVIAGLYEIISRFYPNLLSV